MPTGAPTAIADLGLPAAVQRQRGRRVVQQRLRGAVILLRVLLLPDILDERGRQRGRGVDAGHPRRVAGLVGELAVQPDHDVIVRAAAVLRLQLLGDAGHELLGVLRRRRLGQAGLRPCRVKPVKRLRLRRILGVGQQAVGDLLGEEEAEHGDHRGGDHQRGADDPQLEAPAPAVLDLPGDRVFRAQQGPDQDRQLVRQPADHPAHQLLAAQRHLPRFAHVPVRRRGRGRHGRGLRRNALRRRGRR